MVSGRRRKGRKVRAKIALSRLSGPGKVVNENPSESRAVLRVGSVSGSAGRKKGKKIRDARVEEEEGKRTCICEHDLIVTDRELRLFFSFSPHIDIYEPKKKNAFRMPERNTKETLRDVRSVLNVNELQYNSTGDLKVLPPSALVVVAQSLCYVFFIFSCFVSQLAVYDMLFGDDDNVHTQRFSLSFSFLLLFIVAVVDAVG